MTTVRALVIGGVIGVAMAVGGGSVWAEPSSETQALITAHHQAAGDAQKREAFHEEMAKKFQAGHGGTKIDMVGHCKYWADYYHKLAAQETQAAQELEGGKS